MRISLGPPGSIKLLVSQFVIILLSRPAAAKGVGGGLEVGDGSCD